MTFYIKILNAILQNIICNWTIYEILKNSFLWNVIFFFHKTAFCEAVEQRNQEIIQILLTRQDIDVNIEYNLI